MKTNRKQLCMITPARLLRWDVTGGLEYRKKKVSKQGFVINLHLCFVENGEWRYQSRLVVVNAWPEDLYELESFVGPMPEDIKKAQTVILDTLCDLENVWLQAHLCNGEVIRLDRSLPHRGGLWSPNGGPQYVD